MRREVNIAGKALSRHYWAINREIEQEGRFVTINRSVDHFAVIRLRLEIDFSDAAVTFVNAIDEQALSPYARRGSVEFVDQVIDGIREVLARLSPDSLQIRALKVTLTELQAHPRDSSPHDFRVAAMEAMTKAIQSVGLSPGPQ